MIRLMEVLLHGGPQLASWRTVSGKPCRLPFPFLSRTTPNPLRYDLRKMKGHGLLERVGNTTPTASPKGSPGGRPVRPLSQAHLRPPGEQLVSSPTQSQLPTAC